MTAKEALQQNRYRDIYPLPKRCPNCKHARAFGVAVHCLMAMTDGHCAWVTAHGTCDKYEERK